jgi:hypothetical protein
MERIERILAELRYEVTRGMLEREIEECIHYQFTVPHSKSIPDGLVMCEFNTRPSKMGDILPDFVEPRLRVVK